MGEVAAAFGEPDRIVEFTVPGRPFYGPQESLAGRVPAGTLVEEWQYRGGGRVTYVWFSGEASGERVEWTVIDTAVYPQDAVY